MHTSTKGIIRGVATGVIIGTATGFVAAHKPSKKATLQKKAGKAMKAIGGIIENFHFMMK